MNWELLIMLWTGVGGMVGEILFGKLSNTLYGGEMDGWPLYIYISPTNAL